MKAAFLCSFIASVLVVGCGNNQDSAAQKPGENPLNAPADYVGALGKAQQTAVKTVDAASINQAIQMFEGTEGRHPKSLDELVAMKYMPSLPAPPRGMKFDYNPNTGVLRVVPAN